VIGHGIQHRAGATAVALAGRNVLGPFPAVAGGARGIQLAARARGQDEVGERKGEVPENDACAG
jgi:hypothetical protein